MSVEVLIPWYGDCRHRRRAFEWVRGRYPWPVRIAEGGEPWIKADAVMPAVEASAAEVLVVADADVWANGIFRAVEAVQGGRPWACPHRGLYRLTEAATEQLLRADSDDWESLALELDQPPYLGWEGGGIVVGRREVLLDVPMDRRFVGWGQEDVAFGRALRTLYGPPLRVKRPMLHLWHPPQQRMTRKWGSVAGRRLAARYKAALCHPDQMRSLLGEIPMR